MVKRPIGQRCPCSRTFSRVNEGWGGRIPFFDVHTPRYPQKDLCACYHLWITRLFYSVTTAWMNMLCIHQLNLPHAHGTEISERKSRKEIVTDHVHRTTRDLRIFLALWGAWGGALASQGEQKYRRILPGLEQRLHLSSPVLSDRVVNIRTR